MNAWNKLLLLLMLICCGKYLHAQSETARRAGDKLYAAGNYYAASRSYETWLGKSEMAGGFSPYSISSIPRSNKTGSVYMRSLYQLAESYRNLTHYGNAAAYYQAVAADASAQYPLARYWYSVCLRATSQWGKAEKQLQLFLKGYHHKDKVYNDAQMELSNCRFIITQLQNPDTALYRSEKLPAPLNVGVADYAARWLNDTVLTFTSSRRDTADDSQPYYNRLYSTTRSVTGWGKEELLQLIAAKGTHVGVASFSADGRSVYFTSWEEKGNEKKAVICFAARTEKGWDTPVKMPAPVNVTGASSMEPFVTTDGKYLVFSSDRNSGKGGYDLWYVPLQEKKMGKARNMGEMVNTKNDERAPFYHQSSGILVFSSDGRTGMGGFDLYSSRGNFTLWEEPVNLGYPVNSIKDDMYFFSADKDRLLENVLLSSDRQSACCLEMFSLRKAQVVVASPPKEPEPPVVKTEPEKPPVVEVRTPVGPVSIAVYFEYNSSDISITAGSLLDSLAGVLKAAPGKHISIAGYTDARGTDTYNYQLGLRRANACAVYLRQQGVGDRQLKVSSYGKEKATGPAENAMERKVTITFTE